MRGSHVSHSDHDRASPAPGPCGIRVGRLSVAVFACIMLGACSAKPLMPYSADTPPLVLVPAPYVGTHDQRARFREIFCAVLEARARDIPDYQPCDEALTRVGAEPAGTGRPVALGPSSPLLWRRWFRASATTALRRGWKRQAPPPRTSASTRTTRS